MKESDILIKKSKIHGRGVFANKNFNIGEKAIELKGKILYSDDIDWDSLKEKAYNYLQIGDWEYLEPYDINLECLNHSCNPNLGFKFLNGKACFIAIKPIKEGDELAFDYSTTMLEEEDEEILKCRCGSKNCRKKIGDFRNISKKIQDKYIKLGVVPDYIVKDLLLKNKIKINKPENILDFIKMRILIIGYGAVGEVLVKLLAKEKSVEKINCIDYIPKKVIKNNKVFFQRFDVSKKQSFIEFIKNKKPDLIINTAVPKFNELILECCLQTKKDYMDLASCWDPNPNGKPWSPEPEMKIKSPYKVEQLDYQNQYKKAGLTGLIVAGVSPGLTNLFVREAVDFLDETDYVKIRLVDYSGTEDLYFAWSKEGLLDEIGCKPLVYENGKFKILEPFSGEEIFDFPPPFNDKKVNLICQDEIGTLPFYIKTNKIDIKDYDNLVDAQKLFYKMGLISKKKILFRGVEISPFEFMCKVLPDVPPSLADKKYENAQFAFLIEAIGKKQGKKKAIRYFIMFPKQKEINHFNLNANFITYPTALSAKLFATSIPLIKKSGVFPPECIEKEARSWIIKQLPKNHVKVYKRVYTPK